MRIVLHWECLGFAWHGHRSMQIPGARCHPPHSGSGPGQVWWSCLQRICRHMRRTTAGGNGEDWEPREQKGQQRQFEAATPNSSPRLLPSPFHSCKVRSWPGRGWSRMHALTYFAAADTADEWLQPLIPVLMGPLHGRTLTQSCTRGPRAIGPVLSKKQWGPCPHKTL